MDLERGDLARMVIPARHRPLFVALVSAAVAGWGFAVELRPSASFTSSPC